MSADILALSLILEGMHSVLLHKGLILVVDFEDVFYIEEVPICDQFVKYFCHLVRLEFVKYFFCIYWKDHVGFVLYSIDKEHICIYLSIYLSIYLWFLSYLSLVTVRKIFNVYFWERKRQSTSGGGAESKGDAESEAGFRLWAVSRIRTHWVVGSWPEPKSKAKLTEPPRCP